MPFREFFKNAAFEYRIRLDSGEVPEHSPQPVFGWKLVFVFEFAEAASVRLSGKDARRLCTDDGACDTVSAGFSP